MLLRLVATPVTANYNFIETFWQEPEELKQATCNGVIFPVLPLRIHGSGTQLQRSASFLLPHL